MAELSSKSEEEIGFLLDHYGIKHGPVVASTRRLYEKKLSEAMAKGKKANVSSDKTYYREEEEEVTYVHRTPIRSDGSENRPYMRSRPDLTDRRFNQESYMYDRPSMYTSSYLNSEELKSPPQDPPKAPKSSRFVPLWVQFVFFLAVVGFFYLVFTNMEPNEYSKRLE